MKQVSTEQWAALLAAHEPPCISLYLPTHRRHPEREADPIRYRNLLKSIESSLLAKYSKREFLPLLEPLEALAHDSQFWSSRTDALAIFSSPGSFSRFDLQRQAEELAVVADSFHIKPLLRVLQSADRYQVLCVGLSGARLYEGNRDALDEIELAGESSQITRPFAAGERQSHKDIRHAELGAWLRAIDTAVDEHHSKPSGLPLLMVALPELQSPFREASRNPRLLAASVSTNPDTLDIDALRTLAWEAIEPTYLERLQALVDSFEAARARGTGALLLDDVGAAAVQGRVGTLLVEADREIGGTVDRDTGRVSLRPIDDPVVDDVLDDIAEAVLKARGEVVIVPSALMPTSTGLAAILRY